MVVMRGGELAAAMSFALPSQKERTPVAKRYLWAVCVLWMAGCAGQAQTTKRVGDFDVERLFEVDGCTVYRFSDGGNYRYFTRCDGRSSGVTWTKSCGKNCTSSVDIQTRYSAEDK